MPPCKVLGGGIGVVTVGGQTLVSSVPHQLSTDTNAVLELAQVRAPRRLGAGTAVRVNVRAGVSQGLPVSYSPAAAPKP